jgi:3',5'-cyclic-nucleotide phosphodiesterase
MKQALFLLLIINLGCQAQSSFRVVPLGVKGGTDESNLSAYAVAATGTDDYICLDAGTLHTGIQRALELKTWKGNASAILRKNIKAYLISHPHTDHVAGLILNSPEDSSKSIYGIASCLSVLQEKHFNWKSWANFGSEGEKPLNKYTYQTLVPGKEIPISNTSLLVTAYLLSHVSPNESTAFLIRHKDNYLLYLGDTGADPMEKSDRLLQLWTVAAPLIRDKKLKGIFIEVSFSNDQPDSLLFGHLTPKLLFQELSVLAKLCGNDKLKNFPIVITHMKPYKNREQIIIAELQKVNTLDVKLIFPDQGRLLEF